MPKVLVIDDDPHLRNILTRVLNKNDFEVISAEDGASGLRRARSQRPDLIILDLIMPGMDGFEVAQQLHRDPVSSGIPIMVLTAYATAYGRKTAVDIGVDDFVTKPFGIDDIVSRVRAMTSAPLAAAYQRAAPPQTAGQARLICLHTLRGGLGCTSLAINLATVLGDLWPWPALLLDADFAHGQVALALNRPAAWQEYLSWSDLLLSGPDGASLAELDQKPIARKAGLDVLTASRRPQDAHSIDAGVVNRGLQHLAQSYEYIVADLAHDLRPNTLALAGQAGKILYLLAADAVSIQLARRALAAYQAAGIPTEDVLPLLVDSRPGRPARIGDVEMALGRPLAAYIPYASPMTEAIDRGLPFVTAFPDHRLTHLVEDLAYLLSKPAHRQAGPAQPTPTYQRVRARAVAAAHNGATGNGAAGDGATLDIGDYMLKQAGVER